MTLSGMVLTVGLVANGPWPQWGGPSRDFHAPAAKLAAWPKEGPKRLWTRDLGDGFAAIVTDGPALYTAYRRGSENVAIAMDAATGRTLWERSFDATPLPNMFLDYGKGPNTTPLIAGDRLFVATFTGEFAALDRKTGAVRWTKQLWKEFGGTFRDVGYSNSPIGYKDLVIVPVGGRGKGMIAFRQNDGSVAWQQTDLGNAMSSPILIEVEGEPQLITFMVEGVAGLDPATGTQKWLLPHKTDYDVNSATPVWHAASQTLVVSSAYSSGARGLRVTKSGAQELWFNGRFRVHHGTLMRVGDHVYGSSGDFGPAPMTAVEIRTGKIAWQARKFPKVNMVQSGDKTVILDEDGKLALATLTPEKMTVLAESDVLTKLSWTAPTLAGTKLYIRDRKSVAAYELGQ